MTHFSCVRPRRARARGELPGARGLPAAVRGARLRDRQERLPEVPVQAQAEVPRARLVHQGLPVRVQVSRVCLFVRLVTIYLWSSLF